MRSVLKRPPSTTATQLYQSDANDPSLMAHTLRIVREGGSVGWHIMGGLDSPPYKVALCSVRTCRLTGNVQGKLGIFISHLIPDSPAARAGFKVDDRIISVNGNSLSGLTHSAAVEIILGSGDTLDVVIERPGEPSSTVATSGGDSADAQVRRIILQVLRE